MNFPTATALAHPNIAFIKYWGNTDDTINLPANGSISMNLGNLNTITTVNYDPKLSEDFLSINGQIVSGKSLTRIQNFMEQVRKIAKSDLYAFITSESNFPISAGLASSASGYAALTLAATAALDMQLSLKELSSLARLGSGSAARSVPGGYVEWFTGSIHSESYAESIVESNYWDLQDIIVILSDQSKSIDSRQGHQLASTSPFQSTRVETSPNRLTLCRQAILERDFTLLSEIIEIDSMMMHSVMMTSQPALFYWVPTTLEIIKAVPNWRRNGLPVCVTVDAGANPHLICPSAYSQQVLDNLNIFSGIQSILISSAGEHAKLV